MPETNIYDYEFSVRESEPKRAEMLNRLKDRVQHVDKKKLSRPTSMSKANLILAKIKH